MIDGRSWPELVRRVEAAAAGTLLEAARAGRADEVYALLERGAPPNARDPETGGTALHLAAAAGRLDVVDVLVGWVPVDLHARDAAGATALAACIAGSRRHAAAASGDAAAAPPARGDDAARPRAFLAIAKVLVSVGVVPEPGLADEASGELAAWLRGVPAAAARRPEPELGERAWEAEAALFAHVASSPLAERRAAGDGFAFVTGLADNTRNGVLCSRLPADEADARVAELLGWLRERRVPGQWLIAAETEPPDLAERLVRAGCRAENDAVYMARPLPSADAELPAGLEIATVRDAAEFAEAGADELDTERGEAELLASLGFGDPLRHFVARQDGGPVGVAGAFAESGTLTLTTLLVAPERRLRGIGRALVHRALRDGHARGCDLAVLAPTPATVPFYEALGFTLGRFPPTRSFYTPMR